MTAYARTYKLVRRRLKAADGFSLIELLIAITITLIVAGTTLTALSLLIRTQARDQAYAQEVTNTQTGFARLLHDLRQATLFQSVTPNSIAFQMVSSGATYNVAYSCTAADSLGGSYTRCAQTQALAPSTPATPGAAANSLDIIHVSNGGISNFCNGAGTAPSGSVFFPSNPAIANTDGSTLACDEAYEREIASLSGGPTEMQVLVQVPASGDLTSGGMSHSTVLSSAAFLPNLDAGS
jgi:prepilin-type N-terminal cleavage/methylation domain-containing protein